MIVFVAFIELLKSHEREKGKRAAAVIENAIAGMEFDPRM